MASTILYLLPAYGRNYSSAEELVNDWEEGRDFRILKGPYCSIRDMDALTNGFDYIYGIFGAGDERHRVCLYKAKKNLIDEVT